MDVLEQYFAGPDMSVIAALYTALQAVDMTGIPRLSRHVPPCTSTGYNRSFIAVQLLIILWMLELSYL